MFGSETPATDGDNAPDGARSGSGMGAAAGSFGWAAAKFLGYAALTVGITLMLLRPGGRTPSLRPGRRRGNMFLGSGLLAVLFKSMLGVNGAATTPTEVAAADPEPAVAVAPAAAPEPSSPDPAPASPQQEPALAPTVADAPEPQAVPVPSEPDPMPAPALAPLAVAEPQSEPKPAPAKPAQKTGKNTRAQLVRPQGVTAKRPPKSVSPNPMAAKPAAQKPAVASAKHASAKQQAPTAPAVPVKLGPPYLDDVNGYTMQFPAGWSYRKFTAGSWILDATDGRAALISVGVSRFPENLTADKVDASRIARGIRGRPGTVVHGGGIGVIAGRRCVWHKYTGPVARPGGTRTRMTVVQYLLPLEDGRALDVRAAAAPGQFNELAPKMKQSLQTLRLLAPQATAR